MTDLTMGGRHVCGDGCAHTIAIDGPVIYGALAEVAAERQRQDEKWGEQNHPDGTGGPWVRLAAIARETCKRQAAAGAVTWVDIAREEFHEALAETDPARLRAELVQLAAVAVAWVEAIDRRTVGAARGALPPERRDA